MEELDLTEILKDCPKGTELYSPIFGKVFLKGINPKEYCPIMVQTSLDSVSTHHFRKDGRFIQADDAECMLFPSWDNRDWLKWKHPTSEFAIGDYFTYINGTAIFRVTGRDGEWLMSKNISDGRSQSAKECNIEKIEQYGTERFKTGDKVLVRNTISEKWRFSLFSHIDKGAYYPFIVAGSSCIYCIPYNDDTKHLTGTNEMPPAFYFPVAHK